ncbi:hypothetical protein TWF694_000759 [Orbilia ellipsospora]|uniref:Uncharacterized protein n=1 Tax=Orbilia ellipsospora TaxID=2528407 RepID=A0AAV9XR07_9PEZI
MEELKTLCLHVGIPLSVTITRLYKLKYEFEHASSLLDDLIQDFKDTKRQLSNLQGYLAESNLNPFKRHDCELVLRELHLGVNRLTNQTDCIEMKLNQKSIFGRVKRRHSLISGELDSIHKNIERINNRMSVIRQEIQLDMELENRRERQSQHESVKKDLEIIQKNTIATDAGTIRKEYRKYALAIMTEPFSMDITSQPGDLYNGEDEGKFPARMTLISGVEIEDERGYGFPPQPGSITLKNMLPIIAPSEFGNTMAPIFDDIFPKTSVPVTVADQIAELA